jgi:cysteine-rich CPCC protein
VTPAPSRCACACCGFLTRPGSLLGTFDTCPVCRWQDDPAQARRPDLAGGANCMSLNAARANFLRIGAKSDRHLDFARRPRAEECPHL